MGSGASKASSRKGVSGTERPPITDHSLLSCKDGKSVNHDSAFQSQMGSGVSKASPQEGVNGTEHPQRTDSLFSRKGGKPVNQDYGFLCKGYGTADGVFCGVFDGHGKNGHKVSKMVRLRLPVLLLDQVNALGERNRENLSEKWENACLGSFQKMEKEIKHTRNLDCSYSGTTAVVVLKQGEDIVIANLGDSRAVLGTKTEDRVIAVQLTTDLKPGSPGEIERIRSSNGRVIALSDEPGVERAWLPTVNSPGIAMSRCFGDFVMKKHGLICTPVVTHHRVAPNDQFIVLATDGIWDVLTNDEVTSIVWGVERQEMAAKAVVYAASAAWKAKMPLSKADDCTALCLFLQKKP